MGEEDSKMLIQINNLESIFHLFEPCDLLEKKFFIDFLIRLEGQIFNSFKISDEQYEESHKSNV